MINQTSERLWGVGLAMLSPSNLIDRLLDQIEQFGCVLVPVQVHRLPREWAQVEVRID